MDYKQWLDYRSKLEGRDVSADEQDYDLESFYKDQKQSSPPGHLPDTYKKPNHPTFSDQSKYHVPIINSGGSWNDEGNFTPSDVNLKNMSSPQLQQYFNEVESPEALNIEKNKRFSKIRNLFNK